MVEVKLIEKKDEKQEDSLNIIEVDGVRMTIKDYNEKNQDHPILREFSSLGSGAHRWNTKGYFWSRINPKTGDHYSPDEYVKEMAKNKKVNMNLWNKIYAKLSSDLGDPAKWKFDVLWGKDDEKKIKERVEKNNKWLQDNLPWFTEMVSDMKQLKSQLEATGNDYEKDYNDPNKDKSREELGRRADEIEAYRKKVKGEIEAELNKEPKITNEDLESDNKHWENGIWNTIIALGEKEINDIKSRVLADIEVKRAAKQGKKSVTGQEVRNLARDAIHEIDTERNKDEKTDFFVTWEELEINNPDWRKRIMEAADEKAVKHLKVKVLVDLRFKRAQKVKDKEAWQKVQNGSVEDMNESELAAAIQAFEREEGNKSYKRGDKSQSVEDKLIEKDPELYKQVVIEALIQRLKDNGLDEEEFAKLESDYRKLVNKEITEIEDFKKIKNDLGKRIGEEGAKSKWVILFNRTTTLLAKAKENVTEQIKKDLKTVQEQMKNLKAGTNSYLSGYYKDNKAKVDKLERDLTNYSTSQTGNEPKETPWGIIIPVSLVVVALIGVAALVIVRRRKQDKIKSN